MKVVLRLLTGLLLLTTCSNAQNVFDPRDSVYTYDSTAPAGSNTNPNTPPANTMAKWVRSARLSWDAGKFKCYYYKGMTFRLRFPNNYDSSGATKYPLIVFYHGGGEIGPVTDNEIHLYWGAQLFEQRINAGEWNGFLLFPQETSIGWDDKYFVRVNAVLDTLQRYNNLDPDRIITSGLSSGGNGALAHAQAYPKRIATIIAASPSYVNSMNQDLGGFVHIPLWIANGGRDINPDPSQVNSFVSSFIGAGGNCYQTYLADEGHNTWVFQWALMDINNHDLLSGWWNNAHKAQPLVYYNNNRFCSGQVNARLGITPGYAVYEWQRDNGGGFTGIPGAVTNEYQATQSGKYRVRFQRDAASGWSAWSPNPVTLTQKICTTDTLFAERFEKGNPFYYAATSYKPATYDCQNGVFTSSTYNITLDGSGKTGGRFLLHNTSSGGTCTYTTNDVVWRATAPVTVAPNTNYEYCFYLANRSTTANAKIVPKINGVPVADSFVQSPGSGDGSWTKFRFVWNSGSATAADLALFNKDTVIDGNDFALDEISFGVPASGLLPANELLSFNAFAEAGKNRLQWITADNSPATVVFYIEASPDGIVFHTIGSVPGSSGKSIYTFYDEKPANATQYYRIQQITPDGSSYSQVVAVRSGPLPAPQVFPNPTNGGFALEFSLEKKQTVWITLTSGADGRICYTETLDKFSGHYHKDLDQLRLAKGSYAVSIRTETGTKTIILVKY